MILFTAKEILAHRREQKRNIDLMVEINNLNRKYGCNIRHTVCVDDIEQAKKILVESY